MREGDIYIYVEREIVTPDSNSKYSKGLNTHQFSGPIFLIWPQSHIPGIDLKMVQVGIPSPHTKSETS